MEQRRLGNSGLFVSALGIGCNNFGGRVDQTGTRRVADNVGAAEGWRLTDAEMVEVAELVRPQQG